MSPQRLEYHGGGDRRKRRKVKKRKNDVLVVRMMTSVTAALIQMQRQAMEMQQQTTQLFAQMFSKMREDNERNMRAMEKLLDHQPQKKSDSIIGTLGKLFYIIPMSWCAIKFFGTVIFGLGLLWLYLRTQIDWSPPPPPPPPPWTKAEQLIEHLKESEHQFDSISARIARVPGLVPPTINRGQFAAWKKQLAQRHSMQFEEYVESQVLLFDENLRVCEGVLNQATQPFKGRP